MLSPEIREFNVFRLSYLASKAVNCSVFSAKDCSSMLFWERSLLFSSRRRSQMVIICLNFVLNSFSNISFSFVILYQNHITKILLYFLIVKYFLNIFSFFFYLIYFQIFIIKLFFIFFSGGCLFGKKHIFCDALKNQIAFFSLKNVEFKHTY